MTSFQKKTFVPPFGAAITEQKFRELIKERESAKVPFKCSQPATSSSSSMKPKPFIPPYSKSTDEQQSQSTSSNVTNQSAARKRKGPKKGTSKGKAPSIKRQNEQVNRREDFEDSVETCDKENCCICGKFQPDGLRLDRALRIVTWAQCELCMGWVHLKFCTVEEQVADSDTFHCPMCRA